MRYYIKAFKNYFNNEGRATRKEFWLFFLFHNLVLFILGFCDELFGLYPTTYIPLEYGYLTLAYGLISICPAACIQVRRLHDINKSGNWWLLYNVPIASLYVLYLYLKRGDPTINDYGYPPEVSKQKNISSSNYAYESSPEKKPIDFQTASIEANLDKVPQVVFCRKCGFRLIAGSEFCSKCGTAIVKE